MSSTDIFSAAFALEQGVQADADGSPLLLIKAIRGKGLGIVANTDIFQGELLLRERPIFRIPMGEAGSKAEHKPTERTLEKERGRLSARDRTCFDQLSTADLSDGYTELQNRFATNNHTAGEDEKERALSGVCLFYSRLNHSCLPNAFWDWKPAENGRGNALVLHALSKVRKGNEITISYVDEAWDGRNVRMHYLKKYYGFNCSCKICNGGANHRSRESRISKLKALQKRWVGDDSSRESTPENGAEDEKTGWSSTQDGIMEYCRLVEEELNELAPGKRVPFHRVDHRLSEALHLAGQTFFNAAQQHLDEEEVNYRRTVQHWNTAIEVWAYACLVDRVCYGEDSDEVHESRAQMTRCLLAPRQHPDPDHHIIDDGSKRLVGILDYVLRWRPGSEDLSRFDAVTRKLPKTKLDEDGDADMYDDESVDETDESMDDTDVSMDDTDISEHDKDNLEDAKDDETHSSSRKRVRNGIKPGKAGQVNGADREPPQKKQKR